MNAKRNSRPATWQGLAIYLSIGAFVLLIVGIVVDQMILPMLVQTSESIIVPDVKGVSEDSARTELRKLGLQVPEPHEQFSDHLPAGVVISQMPFKGSTVKEGRRIHLTVSRGIEEMKMPDIRGMTTREARLNLMRIGIALGDIAKEKNDSIAEDLVINQSIQPGNRVRSGTAISILVSEGPSKITMPDLFGMSFIVAESILADYGLTVGAVTKVPTGAFEANTVLNTNPPADSLVDPASAVDVTVSINP